MRMQQPSQNVPKFVELRQPDLEDGLEERMLEEEERNEAAVALLNELLGGVEIGLAVSSSL